jgi:hypothetical protein
VALQVLSMALKYAFAFFLHFVDGLVKTLQGDKFFFLALST